MISDAGASMEKYELIVEIVNEAPDGITIRTAGEGSAKCQIVLDDIRKKMLGVIEGWMRKGNISENEELQLLGTILYEAIFNGQVKNFFESKLGEFERARRANKSEERLRLELSFNKTTAQHLAALPWEFLYYPKDQTFLATKVNIVLTRRMPVEGDREELKRPEGPLKLLLVVARPKEFMPTIKDEEGLDAIIAEILKLKDLKTSQIEIIGPLTKLSVETLAKSLEEHKPDMVGICPPGR